MYKNQADAVKDWLQAYQKTEERIDRQLERLRTLKSRMMSVGAQELSDMPRPPSAPKDRMAEYVAQVDALEKDIEKEMRDLETCKQAILEMTAQLQREDACSLIRYRYLYGYDWEDVLYVLYSKDKELYIRKGTYKRKMYRLHDAALKELSKIWDKKPKK